MSNYMNDLEKTIQECGLSNVDAFSNFSRFTPRPIIANFLNRYEIFKRVLNVHGSIVEGGVNLGQGLFSWLHFSSILEPYNHSRRVIGFDTFEGFTNIQKEDDGGLYETNDNWKEFTNKQSYEKIVQSAEVQNQNRVLPQIPKLEIVRGDATKTIPEYVEKNNHMLISLLHLDFDVYSPTEVALKTFLPRMAKGGIIAFDELNDPNAPGETLAFLNALDIKYEKLERNAFDSNLCYLVVK